MAKKGGKKTKSLERRQPGKAEDAIDELAEQPGPKVNVRFLYVMCNDVGLMRDFYSDVLGMSELNFRDDENFGWAVYDTEGFQLMFFRWDNELPFDERWAWQPGEAPENSAPLMSFSLEYPEDELREVVKRVREVDLPTATEKPTWRQNSYWGWTIKDPMGNTIELFSSVQQLPPEGETPEWVD
jgi:catechol 2,3-dioxygenase-like lactoylglutathione lyase family enzyme